MDVQPSEFCELLPQALAETLGFSTPQRATAVQLVFALARHNLETVFRPEGAMQEEPITGALCGALAAHGNWVTSFYDGDLAKAPVILWGQFKKTEAASDVANQLVSERKSGADFALLVRVHDEHALLGIFQAKVRLDEDAPIGTVKFSIKGGPKTDEPSGKSADRRTNVPVASDESRTSQYVTLHDYGKHLVRELVKLRKARLSGIESSLDWVHYLIYRGGEPWCASLKVLNRHVGQNTGAKSTQPPPQTVTLPLSIMRTFSRLMDFGALRWINERPSLQGWLSLTLDEADELLPLLQNLTGAEIYVADEDGTGRSAWAPKNGKIVNQKHLSNSPSPLAKLANKIATHMASVAANIIARQTPTLSPVPPGRRVIPRRVR